MKICYCTIPYEQCCGKKGVSNNDTISTTELIIGDAKPNPVEATSDFIQVKSGFPENQLHSTKVIAEMFRDLFRKIEHGDSEHRSWLKREIETFIKEKLGNV